MIKRLLFAAAVAWTVWALAGAVLRVAAPPDPAARSAWLPWQWQLGMPQVEALRGFLADVDRRLPADSVVAVANAQLPGDHDFFLYMWCAYYLPRHDVLRLKVAEARDLAQYVVAWHTTLDHPRLELLFAADEGALYRVLPP